MPLLSHMARENVFMCTFLYLGYQLVGPRLTRSATSWTSGGVSANRHPAIPVCKPGTIPLGQQFQNTAFEEMDVPVDLPEKSQRSRKTAQRRR